MPRGEKTKELWNNKEFRDNMVRKHIGKIQNVGKSNGMYGKTKEKSSNWKGGFHRCGQCKKDIRYGTKTGLCWNCFISSKTKESHYNWQGGKTLEEYSKDWTDTLRLSIRERDGFVCQECGIHQDEIVGRFKKLDVHHIDYDKKNCNPNNLITLCKSCHFKTNYNREYWITYFTN